MLEAEIGRKGLLIDIDMLQSSNNEIGIITPTMQLFTNSVHYIGTDDMECGNEVKIVLDEILMPKFTGKAMHEEDEEDILFHKPYDMLWKEQAMKMHNECL